MTSKFSPRGFGGPKPLGKVEPNGVISLPGRGKHPGNTTEETCSLNRIASSQSRITLVMPGWAWKQGVENPLRGSLGKKTQAAKNLPQHSSVPKPVS